MKSKLYMFLKYAKGVKFITGFPKYGNACNVSITLPSCQSPKLVSILEYNLSNFIDLLSADKNKKDIGPGTYNNGNKKNSPWPADTMGKNNKNINQKRPKTPNWIL